MTSIVDTDRQSHSSARVAVLRLTVAGAATAAALFLLCWLGTFATLLSAPHAYIGLFTDAPANSARALWEGLCWSALFGGLAAAVFAILYNSAAGLERR